MFEGGSDRSTAGTSSVASRKFISGQDIISVSLEVHDGAATPKVLRITEFSPRPINAGPEWIEVKNLNGFALSMNCLLYTSPSPRDLSTSRMPSSA